MNREKILNILKYCWIMVVIAGAGWYFFNHFQEISKYLDSLSIFRLFACLALLLIGKMVISDITRVSLMKVDYPIEYSEALTITTITQLGKYLPGGIWHLAGKFGFYKVKGITAKKATQAIVMENAWLLSSASLVGSVVLLIFSGSTICGYVPFLCGLNIRIILSILLLAVWIAGLLIFEWFFMGKKSINPKVFILVLVKQLITWLLFGVSFWLVFPKGSDFILQAIGAFSLSWVVGYIAFFAPGGIGIREVLLTILLGSFIQPEEAGIYAAIHRLVWMLAEIIIGVGSVMLFGMPVDKKKD